MLQQENKVEPERLHGITEIVEELIKEIMDSSFISSSAKKSYCESLKTLTPKKTSELETLSENREVFVARIEYKERMTSLLSLTLGTIAALATMISLIKSTFESSSFFGTVTESIFPMILVMTSVMLVMTAMQVSLKIRNKRIRKKMAFLMKKFLASRGMTLFHPPLQFRSDGRIKLPLRAPPPYKS